MKVRRAVLYVFTAISAAYPFVIAMNNGHEWGEFFRDLVICFAISFVCHTLASVLKKLDDIGGDDSSQQ